MTGEPRTGRAAVWRGGEGIVLEDVPVPPPGRGELIVRIDLATVCCSDRHTVEGRRASPVPGILGHEAVGRVTEAGTDAPVPVGARVVWGVVVPCHSCDRCRTGRTAKCRKLRKVGHEPFDGAWPLSGTYAQQILLPAGTTLATVPDELCDTVAAPAACATATSMAALEAAGPLVGARVLVSGAGMLGLTAAAAAAERGASTVAVVDPDASRRSLAHSFGADETFEPGRELPEVDVALELSGSSTAAVVALRSLSIGGRMVLAGSVAPAAPLPLDPERVVRRWLTITGVHNYEPHHLVEAVDFLTLSRTRWPWEQLVSPAFPLAQLPQLLTSTALLAPRTAIDPRL